MKNNKKSAAATAEKNFMGMPMQWDYKNMHKDIWNPEEDRIFPPRRFGIGWGMNVHAILKRTGLLK